LTFKASLQGERFSIIYKPSSKELFDKFQAHQGRRQETVNYFPMIPVLLFRHASTIEA
jgi:hypothetical protein